MTAGYTNGILEIRLPVPKTEDGTVTMAADLDSIDFLNLMVGIHDLAGLDIPERDYDAVSTLAGLVSYLTARI